jgi:hypothetical protein
LSDIFDLCSYISDASIVLTYFQSFFNVIAVFTYKNKSTMKTKIIGLLLLTGLLQTFGLNAQNTSGGIILGASTTSVKLSDLNNTLFMNAAKGQNIMGFEGGVYAKWTFHPFYIKPMALLNYQAGQLHFTGNDGSSQSADFRDGKLEIPVLIGLHLLGPLSIEGGPVYNWLYMSSNDANPNLRLEESGLGYRIGANVGRGRLNLGLSYQGLTNKSSGSSRTTFQSPNELILDLAIRLGRITK